MRLALLISLFVSGLALANAAADDVNLNERETAECRGHLEKLYSAIQEYRKEHKKLPDYFHDLTPKYIPDADADVFLCPKGRREKAGHPMPHLSDPKLTSHYMYEFSQRESAHVFGGARITMADWRSLQMSVAGGIVPIVRCLLHDPVLNVSFDGKFFESLRDWAHTQAEKVNFEDLAPYGMRLRLARIIGQPEDEMLALDHLRHTWGRAIRMISPRSPGQLLPAPNPEKAALAMEAAAKAAEFPKKYPDSKRHDEARSFWRKLTFAAARAGDVEARRKCEEIAQDSRNSELPVEERFEIRYETLHLEAAEKGEGSRESVDRALTKEFPGQPQPYWGLLFAAQAADEDRARTMALDLTGMDQAPALVKEQARLLIQQIDSELASSNSAEVMEGWGRRIDPSGDCTFSCEGDTIRVTMPGGLYNLTTAVYETNAPRILQDVAGEFSFQVSLTGDFDPGPEAARTLHINPLNSAGILASKRPFQVAFSEPSLQVGQQK
jgi:hypothetical protein